MMVQIRTRDENGKFRDASPYTFAQAALLRIGENGWLWLREQLQSYCLAQAEKRSSQFAQADLWYRRYVALREIQ
jgi:hypothetical protein